MNLLMVVTALAAQATAPVSSGSPTESQTGPHVGTSTYLDLEGGAGYSTNPNLLLNGDGAAFGRISAHIVHSRVSDRTTTVLSAYAQELAYTSHYGSQQSFDFTASHNARVSEKLRIYGDVDASYDKGGQLDTQIIGVPNVPLLPGTTPPVLLTRGSDFLSVTGRSYRASGHVGAQLALGAHDYLDASAGVEHSIFKNGNFDTNYTTISGSLGYSRQISPRTTIGARVVAQRANYSGSGNFNTVTPEATIETRLSETLTFSGAVGASFASVDTGISTRHSTGLTANATLCSKAEMSQFCVRTAIDQEAATAAGPTRNISVGVDYSRRLDADQTIDFSLSGNRYSNPISFVNNQTFSKATYVRAAANYTRKIGGRLFGGISVAARKLSQSGPDPDSDLSASVFVRYRFGDVQ